ncbi:MAG: FAD-dependent oxidoreductase, partial [Luteimonas sp.]|nr:FAD-dependent oxidoreductase [Luteimonas sp.]
MHEESSDRCQWDVVVVGASFAGAACALAARRAGLRVCVLERKRDPGMRLHTTGIIVREAAEGTHLGRMPAALWRRVEHVRLYAPNLRSLPLQSPGDYFLTTDTPNVMRWLAAEMRAAGVELRLMQSFTDARRERNGWQVEGLGRTRWLVGADGAKSRVAARAGLGRVHDFLYGVEHEYAG